MNNTECNNVNDVMYAERMYTGQLTSCKRENQLNTVRVKVINASETNKLPENADSGSAGYDLRADISKEPITIAPGERALVSTGLSIQLPNGLEAQVRPRSGLALKKGITVLNSPGTIDSSYTGDIGVILYNSSDTPFVVSNGDRIAQMVIAPYYNIAWDEAELLDETERGSGGFGHSGVK